MTGSQWRRRGATLAGWAAGIWGAWLVGAWCCGLVFWLAGYGQQGWELWWQNMFDQERAIAIVRATYGADPDVALGLLLGRAVQGTVLILAIAFYAVLTLGLNAVSRLFKELATTMLGILESVSGRGWALLAVGLVAFVGATGAGFLMFWFHLNSVHGVMAWLDAPWNQSLAAVDLLWNYPDHSRIVQARGFAFLVAMMVLALVGIALAKLFGLAEPKPLYGRSSFGSWRQLVKGQLLDAKRRRPGAIVGRWRRRLGLGPLVSHSEDWTHVFVLGPTGCGKGQGFVLPNGLSWPDSLIAFDLKGEAWQKTAGYRRRALHNDVYYFNPTDPERRTCRFNPLGHIDRTNEVQLIGELKKVAEMLMPVPDVGEKFWAQSGHTGFVAAGMVLAQRGDTLSIGTILQELKRPDLQQYFIAIAEGRERPAAQNPRSRFSLDCTLQCSSFAAGGDEKTFGNKRDTLTAALNLWDDPNVRLATEASDFDLRQMRSGKRKMSVYLCASAGNLKILRSLYATIFQLLYDQMTVREPATTDHGVLVILDEFARLGRMSDLQAAFALTRSYKMRFLIVVQSLNQLKDASLYGVHGAEDIAINCDTEVYFTPARQSDAEELSKMLGDVTVKSRSRTRQMRGGGSTSYSDQRQPLMSPQELMEFPQHEVLVKTRGRRAFRLHKIVAWRDRLFAQRLLEAPPAVPPLRLPEEKADALAAIENALLSRMSSGLALRSRPGSGEEAGAAPAVIDDDAADALLDAELVRMAERIGLTTGG
ncbi:MAG: type IV secretory system conjugative DNA transfer family protein [Proteobacteria bacterium]|nr:type IV secretory system conjugative DNA transfer family protein [Pseudomonadota bacterium]